MVINPGAAVYTKIKATQPDALNILAVRGIREAKNLNTLGLPRAQRNRQQPPRNPSPTQQDPHELQ